MNTRDDFFTLIHKALRRELYSVAADAASTDWSDERSALAVVERWRRLDALLNEHSAHEDRHFFVLAERKAPGATAALSEEHDRLDRALEAIGHTVAAAEKGEGGHLVHREMAAFLGDYLPHMETEERYVMPLLWATCADSELAETRAGFMADMPPSVAAFSLRLMLPAVAPPERAAIIAHIRATAPPPVVDQTLAMAADVLPPDAHARLLIDLASAA